MERYSALAKNLLKSLLGIDVVSLVVSQMDLDDVTKFFEGRAIVQNLEQLEFSAAIMAEQLRPELASRRVEMKLRKIWQDYPDNDSMPHWERTENQDKRLTLFSKLVGKKISGYDFVDFILQNPSALHMLIALSKLK